MGAELGATTSIFPYDERAKVYLDATQRARIATLAEANKDLLTADPEVAEDPEKYFDLVVEIDLDTLEPHIVGPFTPDLARPVSQMAADVAEHGYPDNLTAGLIGSCTNSSYEDLTRVADIAEQALAHGATTRTTLWVTPGSEQIEATIERDGQMETLERLGATVLANACGPCIGQWHRDDISEGEVNSIISSFNRNFAKRNDGNPQTNSFLSSPEIVVAYALAGHLSFNPLIDELTTEDGSTYTLAPPAEAPDVPEPDVPEKGFIFKAEGYVAPPEDRSSIEIKVAEGSERLQILEPFPAWDGNDLEGMPILLKARGKCTTDHISQAGPWLKFRGHLDNISDNLFLGANNAFTDQPGYGIDIESGETVQLPKLARSYKERNIPWVAVADENYGEGSSREHAAMEPRHMAGTAVIARSFARIAETNLKKQGVLPLTFDRPSDYEKIRVDDRISLVNLAELAPGRQVAAVINHADDSQDRIQLNQTLNEEQIEWFKAGSALNVLRRSD